MAHVLVIEDNEDLADMVCALLKKEGHIATHVGDGELGLIAVFRDRPDLLVLDLNLPKLDGREICKKLKADPTTKRIPIIMMTAAYTDPDDAKAGLDLGADEYIVKPFMHTPFVFAVQRLLKESDAK